MVSLSDSLKIYSQLANQNISSALIEDLKKAADYVRKNYDPEFTATINSAVRPKNEKSRHSTGQAVDIAIFKDSSYGYKRDEFTKLGNLFVNVLKSMGYEHTGSERGKEKTVIWQSKDHYDHVHVSNTSGRESSQPSADLTQISPTGSTETTIGTEYKSDPALSLFRGESKMFFTKKMIIENIINETTFGQKQRGDKSTIIIPSKHNGELKFPYPEGAGDRPLSVSGCTNELVISFDKYKIQYCGLERLNITNRQKVKKDDIIGRVGSEDVTVKVFDNRNRPIQFGDVALLKKSETKKDDKKKKTKKKSDKDKGENMGSTKQKFVSPTSNKPIDPWIWNRLKKYFSS